MTHIDPVWQGRWQEQSKYLKKLGEGLSRDISRFSTIHSLILCLQAFAGKQIDFFIKGFSNDKLKRCNRFPPEAVMSAIIDQVGNDISVLERIGGQYQLANNDSELGSNLAIGNYLAYDALNKAKEAGLLREETTVLTYFRKSPLVRVIPYAPVVLVGIPHTATGIRRDFLAIPHEIGHYVYRHGKFQKNGKAIEGKFPVAVLSRNSLSYVEAWFEEIFADVYGALVAGPVIGLDFQDLQMTDKVESFYGDDGEHPAPILRPHIYSNVISRHASGWASKLDSNWQNYLKIRDDFLPAEFKGDETGKVGRKFIHRNKKEGKDYIIEIDEAISTSAASVRARPTKPLDKVIDTIRKDLLGDVGSQSWPPGLGDPEEGEGVGDLYDKFDGFVGEVAGTLAPQVNIPELTIDDEDNIRVGDRSTEPRKLGETLFPNRVDKTRDKVNGIIPCEEWLHVFAAAGWATRGPKCEGSTGVC